MIAGNDKITESYLKESCLSIFRSCFYSILHGTDIAPGMPNAERDDYHQVFLLGRLWRELTRINPDVPSEGINDAIRLLTRTESPDFVTNNRRFHHFLTDGVDVEVSSPGEYNGVQHCKVWLLDFNDPRNNDFLAVDEFTVVEDNHNRRIDVVVFINGIPLAVIELKKPGDENATIHKAFNQLQTYKREIPSLFLPNEILVVSDGFEARSGTITSEWNRFMTWRTVDGRAIASNDSAQIEVLVPGLFEKCRFLDYIINFVLFEDDGECITKKSAAYHQYWAVNKAVSCTFDACGIRTDASRLIGHFSTTLNGDTEPSPIDRPRTSFDGRRIGVIWHTQGSGKSLSMVMYAGKLVRHPDMQNPTVVVITDRNDLDDQLFTTFANCKDILRQSPVQAASRGHLQELLKVASGGIVFTTIQKFMPEQNCGFLSDRKNIVVIADEAHRSQYDFIDGFARQLHDALPNASFIGFTGTPIEKDDRNTRAVFGDYIDQYDILRAVEDGATVPIYYESRLVRIEILEEEKSGIDPEFDFITEGEEETERQKLKSKWATLEAMVGAEKRLNLVANDIIEHFEKRAEILEGKAMIVCMSRRICVDLYNALVKLRPQWGGQDDTNGLLKVVMTGAPSDPESWQQHIRNKQRREKLARRFKDEHCNFRIVIVRDMWLTGFDCPSLHTMYLDKPMGGHNLMQAIARVNRVFRDKPGGLVVDYLGIADSLKLALAAYTDSGSRGEATIDQAEAVRVFLEKHGILRDLLHGFDYHSIITGDKSLRLSGIIKTMNFILGLSDGKSRFMSNVSALGKAFALAVPSNQVLVLRDEVGFFQEVRAAIFKTTGDEHGRTPEELELAIKQLVSRSLISTEVVDIFKAAGIEHPDISILSDQFLEEVKGMPQRNLAIEALRKLLSDEIKYGSRKNVVQSRSFTEMLEEAVRKYQNRAIDAADVINELIGIARKVRESNNRGLKMGLNDDELAFYDALADNNSAMAIMGDDKLRFLAQELVKRVRESVSIDWNLRETARAQIRVLVKRILRQHGYPPDMEQKATDLMLEQTEVLCREWVN
ncbi:MAG: type I restriction endonuclease subunit R [Saccharofermentanales bacterium]